ncbi:hypothetical protein [Methanosarcina sp. Kolksee]|nr:hypothetical protein [Methanosarcina sp. Kolksee]
MPEKHKMSGKHQNVRKTSECQKKALKYQKCQKRDLISKIGVKISEKGN